MQMDRWVLHFPINTEGRYPLVDQIIPNVRKVQSGCRLDLGDVAFLDKTLPRLPGSDEESTPVTLDLSDEVVVRAKAAGQNKATELVLSRSQVTGKAVRMTL